jgi:hypothetical protein
MKRIPALDTVAGVANLKSLISKSILMCGLRTILSLEASVKILLSSMTEFIDSIQFASKSPSRTNHFGFVSYTYDNSLIVLERRPSFHSLVASKTTPYNSLVLTTFGFKSTKVVFLLSLL